MSDELKEVSTPHPDYTRFLIEWREMRDVLAGATAVKARGETHLPKPDGFAFLAAQDDEEMRSLGVSMWESYLARAQFLDFVSEALSEMIGTMHRVPAQIDLPEALEPLRENATLEGLTLASFHKRVTRELLSTSRAGVHPDLREEPGGGVTPYLTLYDAESILNWAGDGTFYVLSEAYKRRDGFKWEDVERYRVLEQDPSDGAVYYRIIEESGGGQYVELLPDGVTAPEVIETEDGEQRAVGAPLMRSGGERLDRMPFVVGSALDMSDELESPPLIGMARAALSAYRLDADYRHQLFWTGQETFVITGIEDSSQGGMPSAFGAGIHLTLPPGADAKYVGPSGTGIAAHRQAIEDDVARARRIMAAAYDAHSGHVESGEAKRLRLREKTVKLIDIALSSAAILERAIRNLAYWIGADEGQVRVLPSLDFVDTSLEPDEVRVLIEAWQSGAISRQTLYERLREGEIASADRSFEEELELIEQDGGDFTAFTGAAEGAGRSERGIPVSTASGTGANDTTAKAREGESA